MCKGRALDGYKRLCRHRIELSKIRMAKQLNVFVPESYVYKGANKSEIWNTIFGTDPLATGKGESYFGFIENAVNTMLKIEYKVSTDTPLIMHMNLVKRIKEHHFCEFKIKVPAQTLFEFDDLENSKSIEEETFICTVHEDVVKIYKHYLEINVNFI